MLKRLSCTLMAAACALLMLGCGESTTTNTNSGNTNTNANRSSTTSTTTTTSTAPNSNAATGTTTTTTASAGEKIGVAECDDFIEKYDACISSKVPEAARAQYRTTIEQWRNSWRSLAANPQTKASLTAACKTSIEQARASMKSYGCEF